MIPLHEFTAKISIAKISSRTKDYQPLGFSGRINIISIPAVIKPKSSLARIIFSALSAA
jgi:hypothetical protein